MGAYNADEGFDRHRKPATVAIFDSIVYRSSIKICIGSRKTQSSSY